MTKSLIALLICSCSLFAHEPCVVQLTPPQISKNTLLEEVVCTRPMREGKFNISLEHIDGKTVTHCYGHGGSGWTTLFGSVDKAIQCFEETHPSKATPIRVIGSGCMGLTTAIELTRCGYHVAGISTKSLLDTPSWKAAGYFALVSLKTSPEEQENLNEIGLETFRSFQKIERGEHPYISQEAVRFMPVYCSIDTGSGVEDLEKRGIIPPREYVTLDFGNGVLHPDFVAYMTYFMNTTTLMHQLIAEVERLGIPLDFQEIRSFGDVQEKIVFNCSGLGAKELNADTRMIPVRGHLFNFNDASGNAHMDYMIYTKVEQDGKDEYIYLFPKDGSVSPSYPEGRACNGTLGGTFIPHVDRLSPEDQEALDRLEFQRMLDRSTEFFHGHRFNE